MIWASVALGVPNMHMERGRISQAPIVEDFIHKFHDCTISTPWGNDRKRLFDSGYLRPKKAGIRCKSV